MKNEITDRQPGGDVRCDCGSLVARITDNGVELKCRRCKRIRVIPLLQEYPGERRGKMRK